tara:strand:+ start:1034 stop:1714 length:681 start_codon:yes stop_codon:yes gene_type:complete
MKELIDALVKAQSEMTHGLATGVNPHFKSEYAPLDEVIRAVKKPLNDNGIFFLQKVYLADNGQCVETEFHGHGAVVKGGKVYVIADKKTPQGYGSSLSYAKRYSLQTACGLPTGNDDDGNQAEIETETSKYSENPVSQVEDLTVAYTEEELKEFKDEAMDWIDGKSEEEIGKWKEENQPKLDSLRSIPKLKGVYDDLVNKLVARKKEILAETKEDKLKEIKGEDNE